MTAVSFAVAKSAKSSSWAEILLTHGPRSTVTALRSKSGGTVTLAYILTDPLSSVSVLTDETGNVVQRNWFDPWGAQRNADGSTDAGCALPAASRTTRGYTGQEEMTVPPSTAPQPCLINYNARLYDPQIARFLSADSIIPDPMNGQSFNRYAYVANNPLNAVDPSGYAGSCTTTEKTGCPPPVQIDTTSMFNDFDNMLPSGLYDPYTDPCFMSRCGGSWIMGGDSSSAVMGSNWLGWMGGGLAGTVGLEGGALAFGGGGGGDLSAAPAGAGSAIGGLWGSPSWFVRGGISVDEFDTSTGRWVSLGPTNWGLFWRSSGMPVEFDQAGFPLISPPEPDTDYIQLSQEAAQRAFSHSAVWAAQHIKNIEVTAGAEEAISLNCSASGCGTFYGAGLGLSGKLDVNAGSDTWQWNPSSVPSGAAVQASLTVGYVYGLSFTSTVSQNGSQMTFSWGVPVFGVSAFVGGGYISRGGG